MFEPILWGHEGGDWTSHRFALHENNFEVKSKNNYNFPLRGLGVGFLNANSDGICEGNDLKDTYLQNLIILHVKSVLPPFNSNMSILGLKSEYDQQSTTVLINDPKNLYFDFLKSIHYRQFEA